MHARYIAQRESRALTDVSHPIASPPGFLGDSAWQPSNRPYEAPGHELLGIDDVLNEALHFGRGGKLVPHRLLDIDEALSVDLCRRNDLRTTLEHRGPGILFLGFP